MSILLFCWWSLGVATAMATSAAKVTVSAKVADFADSDVGGSLV